MFIITGGAGFIGSNLAAALSRQAPGDVVVCDWLGAGDKWKNIAKCELADVIAPDRLMVFLESAARSIDAVLHMGAISSTTETDVDRIVANNVRLSVDLWDWCCRHQKRFLYASSAATYGDGSGGFDDDGSIEHLTALRPLNAYGWSKHLFDRIVARRSGRHSAPPQWVGLKFFNVYGPNEYHKGSMQSVVAKSYPIAAAGRPVRLFQSHDPDYPDGGQLRDFVYVKDCVRAVQWLLNHPGVCGLFNVGTGQARSFADLAGAVFQSLGRPANIEYVAMPDEIRDKYQYFTQANIGRLRHVGFDLPFTTLEEGVRDYVLHYLAADDPYAGPECYPPAPSPHARRKAG